MNIEHVFIELTEIWRLGIQYSDPNLRQAEFNTSLQGFWIEKGSKLHTLLLLQDARFKKQDTIQHFKHKLLKQFPNLTPLTEQQKHQEELKELKSKLEKLKKKIDK